jgi:hypothetical protein
LSGTWNAKDPSYWHRPSRVFPCPGFFRVLPCSKKPPCSKNVMFEKLLE